jgi:transglutaminase-like putative cysteine protease
MGAAAGVTLAAYPDCDTATVDEKIEWVYRADGTGEYQDEIFSKVLTEKGRRDSRTLSLSFMLPYSKIEIYRLEIIAPTGEVRPVDVAANSSESIDDSQMALNIYDPNDRLLKVNIPSLDIGDVVHTIVRDTTERPYIGGQAADENLFEGRAYIRHLVYEIRSPKDRPLAKVALRDEVPNKVAYQERPTPDGGLVHRWEVSDVPRMFDESSEPSYMEILQRLYVSTMSSWREVSTWYWNLARPHLDATSQELKAEVGELTANASSDDDKIQSLFYYVSKNIRYMGLTPERDRPGFEPHDVRLTFEKKYGVCRDKAALLVEMLRLAGLDAYPVLISVDAQKDPDVPNPFFDHAIVAVASGRGGYKLMDPTDEHTRRLLPDYDDDRSYLVCRPEGETLMRSPVQPSEGNMMRLETTGVLTAGGVLQARSTLTFEGVNDDSYRSAFAHMNSQEVLQFFETRLKRSQSGARISSLKLTPENVLDTSSTLQATIELTISGLTAAGDRFSVLTLPWIGKDFGVINYLLDGAGLDARKYPLRTSVTCGSEETLSIRLAQEYTGTVSLPSPSSVEDESLAYGQDVGVHDDVLVCHREFKLKNVAFSPEQYLKLKQTLKLMDFDDRKSPVLAISGNVPPPPAVAQSEAPGSDSNARILDDRQEVNIKDGHDCVIKVSYKKQILSYEGKVQEAEVKVKFDPACESVRLTKGLVISKGGARQEISPKEIQVMDDGWNASAKRYTGGKVLVANLPGIDIGSTIEVAYEISVHDKPFVYGSESFRLRDLLDRKTFVLSAPSSLPIRTTVDGPPGSVKGTEREDKGIRTFQWQVETVGPAPSESDLPPAWLYEARVDYFAGDAGSDLEALADTMLKRSSESAQAGEIARGLKAHSESRLASIEAIRDFVAKSIRQAGPYFGELPLGELSSADRTLSDGYGHAADRAILLYAMLKSVGFDPEFVLASQLPAIPAMSERVAAFPSLSEFRTPLVRVVLDGQAYYLNDTDQYAELGSTPSDGRLGLDLSTQAIQTINAVQGCSDGIKADYSLRIAEDGSARFGVALRYFGDNYDKAKRYFAELPPQERRLYFQQLVSGVAQGARPEGDLTTDFGTYPGVESYAVTMDNFAVVDGSYMYFNLPLSPTLFKIDADTRTLPYFISRSSETEGSVSLELPQGFSAVLVAPPSQDSVAPDGCGRVVIAERPTDRGFEYTFKLEASPTIVDAKDYPTLLSLEASLEQRSSRTFLLKRE